MKERVRNVPERDGKEQEMFAINKNTRRKINRVTLVEVFYVVDSEFEHGEGSDVDTIFNTEWEGPSPSTPCAANTYWDDDNNECEMSDLKLVDTLPAGYDGDGNWVGRVWLDRNR